MKLQEWTEAQLQQWTTDDASVDGTAIRYVFFYTPLCGTCKVGERMLEIVLELDPRLPLGKCNVNVCRSLPFEWKVESVPCLLQLDRGVVAQRRYRMDSVDELYRFIKQDAHTI
ncbi:thioredoxin family protein [Paenibacillus allorhizosphaerae]|uniref:Thioredoxin domain-containing protein n=1 Tax=Paenibacillus allorhizosphaerae TaxID=2849866 RepID=A0ABM8VE19_9BACL|nr:thioredoxin family protein [Paenibacillus allorhizosphaerae]CAG7629783.1 hypothetical protein PAECIP111802_01588 [Paenibacillus allorhizosphaerae]